MKGIEILNRRKAREKHFLQKDGTIRAEIYDDNIHFLKNGKYEEIDNTLIEKNGYYSNKSNSYKAHFSKDSKHDLMTIESNGHFLSILLKDNKGVVLNHNKRKSKNKFVKDICYNDILDGIDFEYKILPTKVKEAIVIKGRKYVKDKIDFTIETDLELELNKDNSIEAKYNSETVFNIDTPYMIDNSQRRNDNVFYELIKKNDKYILSLHLDYAWLNNKQTEYPVIIDPTITTSGQNSNIYDTYIYSGDTNVDRGSQDILKAGVDRVNGVDTIYRTLIKFDLPTIGTGSQVIDARLNLMPYPLQNWTNAYLSNRLSIHQITSDWSESSANWNNMNNNYNKKIETIMSGTRSTLNDWGVITNINYSEAIITNLVKKWYSDTPNYGILIKQYTETYQNNFLPAFFSKDNTVNDYNPKPVLSITYRNQNGLESYMDYKKYTLAQGIIYINSYNGNLVAVFNLGKTIASKLPASLNVVYNTNDVILNKNLGIGLGWQFNYNQTIKSIVIENKNYLEYVDCDGTIHYYCEKLENIYNETTGSFEEVNNSPGTYYDEDGLDTKIVIEQNKYILYDKNNNKMTFNINSNVGYLSECEDLSNNKITINYNSNNQIEKVTDSDNNEVNIEYYNDNIKVIFSEKVSTIFIENNKLKKIQTTLGDTQFSYNSNNIIEEIDDTDGKYILCEYYNVIPYRMKKFSEYGRNGTIGRNLNYKYSFNCTSILDEDNQGQVISFNNLGNINSVTNIMEDDNLSSAYSLEKYYGDEETLTNKELGSRFPTRYVKNYLSNTDFENDDNLFTSVTNCQTTITSEESYNSSKSLKIESTSTNNKATYNVAVPKGNNYTFSAYIKNSISAKFSLSYLDENNNLIEEKNNIVGINNEFERYDVTIMYPENAQSNLNINIILSDVGIAYIDNIQLEEGEVANEYNYIENSDFSNGTTGWDINSNDKEIVEMNGVKVLKIPMSFGDGDIGSSCFKTINVSGNQGDRFTLAFWYKNEGIIAHSMNNVVVNFINSIQPEYGKCAAMADLTYCNSEWHFFHCNFVADAEYTSIDISLFQGDVNDLYLTEFYLFKNESAIYYNYDENGNITSVYKPNNTVNSFNYDKNNELIKMINPKGDNFTFEYDNIITDRVINGISGTSINNKIKYNENQNPFVATLCNTGVKQNIENGTYMIRAKGTEKYVRFINGKLLISKCSCCSDSKWNIEINNEENYRFSLKVLGNKYITVNNENFQLDSDDSIKSEFLLEKQANDSYIIKSVYNNKCLKNSNDSLILADYEENNFNFEFYIEKVEYDYFSENYAKYTEDNKYIREITDTLLRKNEYTFSNGLISTIVNSKGIEKKNYYDNNDRLIKVIFNSKEVEFHYNEINLLDKIISGNKVFNFIFDEFNNVKSIKIGDNITLITHEYNNSNGDLIRSEYGNGNKIYFSYDDFRRLSKITKMNNTYNYKYRSDGNLGKIVSDIYTAKYYYDNSKKLIKYIYNDELIITYDYNELEKITNKKIKLNNDTKLLESEYDKDGTLRKFTFDNQNINYNFDYLGRVKSKNINDLFTINYKYVTNGKRTSMLINELDINNTKYKYLYDKLGLITHIYKDNVLINKHYYDNYNQLIKEIDYSNNYIVNYSYDENGNILRIKKINLLDYSFISENRYEYNDIDWEDKLTKYNNYDIIYDDIGNPIKIGNTTLDWINGRELSSYTDENKTINYLYNNNGIRINKKINGVETKYYVEGKKIIFEVTNNDIIYFIYDSDEEIIGFKYNNKIYFYVKNLQEDIIGILDEENNQIVSYEYDSLGNIINVVDESNNNIGTINPFRYRSYYYDKETNLYYLNDRYYNPEFGRFINADGVINGTKDIRGYNLYAYCANDFINGRDENGNLFSIIKNSKKVQKKILNKVIKVVAIVAAGAVSPFLPISSTMLGKSLIQTNHNTISNSTKNKIADKTKDSPEIKSKIKEGISSSQDGSFKIVGDKAETEIDFTSDLDLHLSIGHAKFEITGDKVSNDTWSISLRLWDDYDFENIREESRNIKDVIIKFINNVAFGLQEDKELYDYPWEVTYTFEYKEE